MLFFLEIEATAETITEMTETAEILASEVEAEKVNSGEIAGLNFGFYIFILPKFYLFLIFIFGFISNLYKNDKNN